MPWFAGDAPCPRIFFDSDVLCLKTLDVWPIQ